MAVLQLAGEDIWQFYCCRLRMSLGEDIRMAILELVRIFGSFTIVV